MNNKILAYILLPALLISSIAPAAQTPQPSDLIPPLHGENPAKFGFKQFSKCHGEANGLGDTQTAAACLAACQKQPETKGCWWLDGTGGFARECRICLDGPPARDIFSNDWGIAITH